MRRAFAESAGQHPQATGSGIITTVPLMLFGAVPWSEGEGADAYLELGPTVVAKQGLRRAAAGFRAVRDGARPRNKACGSVQP